MQFIRPVALACALAASFHCAAQTAAPVKKGVPPRAAAASAADLIERARTLLQAGEATQALAAAQEAQRRDAGDYRAAYYIAYALMALNDLPAATAAQQKAEALAKTDGQRATVRTLGEAIVARGSMAEADKAAAEGLHAKAARLYAAAFDAGLPDPEAGLKAARLYERLGELTPAARLLNGVVQRFAGTPAAATAAGELNRLKPTLAARAKEKVEAAKRLPPGNREATLREALELDASNREAQVALAAEAVHRDDWAEFERRAKALQTAELLEPALASGALNVDRWAKDARLVTLLSDMWGATKARFLLSAEIIGEWRVDYVGSSNCRQDGSLVIERLNGDGSYSGSMRLVTCQKTTVVQDALVKVSGADVDIAFSNPRVLTGSGGYSADHYYMKRTSNTEMRGHNKDAQGSGGQGVLIKVR